MPKWPRAQSAAFDQSRQPRRVPRIAALPARQPAIAQSDAVKGGKRRRRSRFDSFGDGLLSGQIAGTEQAEPIDQQHLLERRSADQAAIVELR